MNFIKINDVRIGAEVCVQEPTEHFSHTCFIFHGFEGDFAKMEMANNDAEDGQIIDFPVALLNQSRVWRVKR